MTEPNPVELDQDPYMVYRKCSNCGHDKMVPQAPFRASSFSGMTEFGTVYQCPNCNTERKIRNWSSIVTGSIFAAIAAFVGYLAFINGPYWYVTHFSYLFSDSYEAYFYLIDLFVFVLYSAVALFGIWAIWNDVISPIKMLIQHPVTGTSREMSSEERKEHKQTKLIQVASFFVFPFAIYIPLFAGIWILKEAGIDIRTDEFYKYLALVLMFAIGLYLAKRFKVEFGLVFFGMAFWMAIIVAGIFLLQPYF